MLVGSGEPTLTSACCCFAESHESRFEDSSLMASFLLNSLGDQANGSGAPHHHTRNGSSLSILKQSIKMSIGMSCLFLRDWDQVLIKGLLVGG